MNIDDLKKSVSEMSEEEIYNLILETRASRRQNKKDQKKVSSHINRQSSLFPEVAGTIQRKSAGAKAQSEGDIDKLIANMSPELLEQMTQLLLARKK